MGKFYAPFGKNLFNVVFICACKFGLCFACKSSHTYRAVHARTCNCGAKKRNTPLVRGGPKAPSCMHTQIFNLCVHARRCVKCARAPSCPVGAVHLRCKKGHARQLLAVSRTRALYTNLWLCIKNARRCTSKLCLLRFVKQSVCCRASNLCPSHLHTKGVLGVWAQNAVRACSYLHRPSDDRSSAPSQIEDLCVHDQALLASALRADASSMMLCVRALCPEGA